MTSSPASKVAKRSSGRGAEKMKDAQVASLKSLVSSKIEKHHLLTDEQVITFLVRGYILIEPGTRPELHEEICRQFDKNGIVNVELDNDPYGDKIFEKAPGLHELFNHPSVEGVMRSLLGAKRFNFGWYCHEIKPGGGGIGWHQDDVNIRHHQVRRLTVMYYPQTVTEDMAPTYVVPSTHFWNTPTDRMANLGNIRNQVALTVKAGTIAFTHYDLWHTASPNTSQKVRYMVKLYSDRLEEPTAPAWNHDTLLGDRAARQRLHFENPGLASGSEWYKERHLRWQAWQHLKGELPGSRGDLVRVPTHDEPVRLDSVQGYIGDPRL